MKIITQLVILTLSLLLVNAYGNGQYCSSLISDFKNNCTASLVTIDSCCDLRGFLASGVYKTTKGTFDKAADTYCDMVTDDGGWIVIQRNKRYSAVSFDREWTDYEKGFGDLNTEFWYGLEEIHCLTQRGQWEMRVDYQKNDKSWTYLHYNQFSVGSANEEYPLTVGGFTGQGTDQFSYPSFGQNGMKFTTLDKDNDKWSGNCGDHYKSGWWHNRCYWININKQPPSESGDKASNILFTEMKIRPKDCITK